MSIAASQVPVVEQDPSDPSFVSDPYPFYAHLRSMGEFVFWKDYEMIMATTHSAVHQVMKHKSLGRAVPAVLRKPVPAHLQAFSEVEAYSLLELEPPEHTRLRREAVQGFAGPRIAMIAPVISQLADRLIDQFPDGDFDLIDAYAKPLAALAITEFLGIDAAHAAQLQFWSNQMVAMYQARRDEQIEINAEAAAVEIAQFMRSEIEARRRTKTDDFLSQLVNQNEMGGMSEAELLSMAVLLMNAGHEATAHTLGNAVSLLTDFPGLGDAIAPDSIAGTVEEVLRYRPPLHMFTRYVYEDCTIEHVKLGKNSEIGCLLAAANRDDAVWPDGELFDPFRLRRPHVAFGVGIHSCVGAALARLELQIAIPVLYARCPKLKITSPPKVADLYHFHGFEKMMVTVR